MDHWTVLAEAGVVRRVVVLRRRRRRVGVGSRRGRVMALVCWVSVVSRLVVGGRIRQERVERREQGEEVESRWRWTRERG